MRFTTTNQIFEKLRIISVFGPRWRGGESLAFIVFGINSDMYS